MASRPWCQVAYEPFESPPGEFLACSSQAPNNLIRLERARPLR